MAGARLCHSTFAMEVCMRVAPLLAIVACGCGVPPEKYNSALDELSKAKAALAAANRQCAARVEGLQKRDASDEAQLDALKAKQRRAEERAQQFRDLLAKFKAMIDSGKLKVEIRNGLMRVKLAENVLFDPGKIDLKSAGKEALVEVSKILSSIPDRKFQVAGHTDNAPLAHSSKYGDNWGLSTARAVEVLHFMTHEGKMPESRLSAAGWADQLPIAKNDSDDGRQQNRRIEIVLLPNIEDLPPMEDTKAP